LCIFELQLDLMLKRIEKLEKNRIEVPKRS